MAAVDRSVDGADRVAAGDSWRGDRALNPRRVPRRRELQNAPPMATPPATAITISSS